MYQDPLAPDMVPLDSQCHVSAIQLSAVDAHVPILEAGFLEFALTPVALEVTAKACITGFCEKMTLLAGEPIGLVQKADPIPGG